MEKEILLSKKKVEEHFNDPNVKLNFLKTELSVLERMSKTKAVCGLWNDILSIQIGPCDGSGDWQGYLRREARIAEIKKEISEIEKILNL